MPIRPILIAVAMFALTCLGRIDDGTAEQLEAKAVITAGVGTKEVDCFLGVYSRVVELFVAREIALGQTIRVVEKNGGGVHEVVVARLVVELEKHLCRINPAEPGGSYCQPIVIQPCQPQP